MKLPNSLYVDNREDWRRWLKKNHKISREVWLIYYKKHSGKTRIPYDDAVEEALCFGWIDSIVRRIDDEKYAQKFTPRNDKSIWSESNKKRVEKLIKQEKMTKSGMIKVEYARNSGEWYKPSHIIDEHKIPEELTEALIKNTPAQVNFNKLAPSFKRQYIAWIITAKKTETRQKRIRETVKLLSQNQKLGMK